ncbi:hypothetical protein PSACC_00782 [Paramicrosporidium saccamoebae]|uniref:GATA-type domain-containing protein n=1 Tax=Paramicrosporidium saccamoebae TaxID=1246581 RepID=A0A2H9TNQ6_9FUNG|nr:hypothetical protein PSACC_00782 [Paramicrosporidium saccamoebae]
MKSHGENCANRSLNEGNGGSVSLASLLNPIPTRAELDRDALVNDAVAGLLRSGRDFSRVQTGHPLSRESEESSCTLKSDRTVPTQALPSIRSVFGMTSRPLICLGRFEAAKTAGPLPDVSLTQRYFEPYARPMHVAITPNRREAGHCILPSGPVPDVTRSFRRCTNCGTQDTPSWRRCGPENILLCNACGLYYNEHRRHRPFRVGQDGRTKALRVRAKKTQPCTKCGCEIPAGKPEFLIGILGHWRVEIRLASHLISAGRYIVASRPPIGPNELVDQAKEADILDSANYERYVKRLEAAQIANVEARRQHLDEPNKFFESEMAVYALAVQFGAAATDMGLLEKTTEDVPFLTILLSLFGHPNDDISEVSLRVIYEIMDSTPTSRASASIIYVFISKLVALGIFGVLLDAIVELGLDDEEGIEKAGFLLELVEHLLAWIDPEAAPTEALVEGWSIWLMDAVLASTRMALHASEILVELLTTYRDIRIRLLTNDNMSQLLSLLQEQSAVADQLNLCTNIADIICALLLDEAGKPIFISELGFELCFFLIRETKACKSLAIKMISFALSESTTQHACTEFVKRGGLKYIFPLFMTAKSEDYKDEEYLCGALAALFRSSDGYTERLVAKFTENDGEKKDRLVNLIKSQDNEAFLQHCCTIATCLMKHGIEFPDVASIIEKQADTFVL